MCEWQKEVRMRIRFWSNVCLVCLGLFLAAPSQMVGQEKPADFVNPLAGTANEGQTYPAAGVPFAMTQWTPATQEGQRKGLVPYYYADTHFRGFRGSHFPTGSATQEYGSTQIIVGAGRPDFSAGVPDTPFSHNEEHSTPYLYEVTLPQAGVKAALTGTSRCGMLRLEFLKGGQVWIAVENFALPGDGEVAFDKERKQITSRSAVRRLYAGNGQLAGFSGYSVVELNRPFTSEDEWPARKIVSSEPHSGPAETSTGAWLSLTVQPGEVVYARIGTSFTSFDEARKNLRDEIPDWNFEHVAHQAEAVWNRELGKIEVEGPLEDRRVFYTALYHAMLLPRVFSDASGTYPRFGGGQSIEKTNGRTYYDDFSIWDTFRALHPLFTILNPKLESEMVQSLIDKGEQGGFLPIFPAWNSYTTEMDGDHGVAIIGDAWLKGIRGFDMDAAYRLMRRNALESPATAEEYVDGKGRRALQSYLKYGYIPLEDPVNEAPHKNEQVSRTLDYAYDDFVLSQVAQSLGKKDDAVLFAKRAQNYRNVIDPETRFARGRHADGSWVTPFDPDKPASYITEGLPFQFTFFVPQDVPGLIELEGGDNSFVGRLDELFSRNLYDHGNEPSHQISYLYDYAGAAPKTQEQVHRIVSSLYADKPDGLAGNDDAGQMSAWYALSALGFYPVTPGIPAYEIGTPHFSKAAILIPGGKKFTIVAHNLSATNFYIQSATLNGAPLNRFWLTHAEIISGGTLVFEMGSKPDLSWPGSKEAPPSL